ncbi:hypothetical protein [Streptomyces parvulus]|uniref:hypothetical protein n=1 Tax=Streptomyces parvulus TaxID=146923 RepID=UPI0036C5EBEC
MLDLFSEVERFERRIDLCRSLTCGFVSEVSAWATPSEGLSEILDARMTLEAEVSAVPPQALRAAIFGPRFWGTGLDRAM